MIAARVARLRAGAWRAATALRLGCAAAALTLVCAAAAHGQPVPPASPAPVTGASKPCDNAHRKVAREQRFTQEVADALARAQRARATCVSRSACARADETIRDTELQQARQAKRLARFEQEVAAECAR